MVGPCSGDVTYDVIIFRRTNESTCDTITQFKLNLIQENFTKNCAIIPFLFRFENFYDHCT
jgi:hypothetical protein